VSNTCTWSGAKSFEWTESDNWGGGVPGPDDDVIIPGGGSHPAPVPPAGTVVRNLEISGNGGLQARLAVTSSFSWLGGQIYAGVDLRQARIDVAGKGNQRTGGTIEIRSAGTLTETDVGLFGPIRLVNVGQLNSSGLVRLWWVASQNPTLHNRGTLSVDSGTLNVHDVVAVLEGTTVVAPGATLLLETLTVPTFLVRGTVTGGGTVRVRNGGLFAARTSRVAAGTTFVLDPGGAVEEKPRNNAGYVDDPGKQELVLDGQFTWNGGTIYGDVRLTGTAVLNVTGPDQHGHASGTVLLLGSGVIAASTNLDVAAGRLRVDGDLLLQSPLQIPAGKGWTLDVRGTLRIAGTQTVTLGNNPLMNRGRIEVTEGILRLGIQTNRLTQDRHAELALAPGTELHGDDLMRLGGTITGGGRVVGDLDAWGTVQPGTPPNPGRLNVQGLCHLNERSRTRIRLESDVAGQGYSQLWASGTVEVDGGLLTEAGPNFAVRDGQVLDIIRSDAPYGVAGRFRSATLPRPAGGRFLRVQYTPQAVQLVAATNFTGVDANEYPGDDVMRQVIQEKAYQWVGYYLHNPPHHTDDSWLGRREFLVDELDLGSLVTYVGRQDPADGLNAANGQLDAQDACDKTLAEGFPDGTWIYLDVEWSDTGITPSRAEYVVAWARQVLQLNRYSPAIYCPGQDVPALFAGLMNAFRGAGRDDRPRFWVAINSRPFDPTLPPADSGTPEAVAWQQLLSSRNNRHYEQRPNGEFYRTADGRRWETDLNVAVLGDPSAPEEG